jgi:signal transduction histidine kinase
MKIRNKLTLLFTILTISILTIFATIIYLTAKNNREKEFFTVLTKEAITKANLFFNAKVETHVLQDIYSSNRKILDEVEVAIFDSSFQLLYHDAVDIDFVKETPEMIKDIYQNGELRFYQEDWQVVGIQYMFEGKTYVITAAAYDQYGINKLNSLLRNITLVFIFAILFIYLAGLFLSKKAFEPVRQMTEKAKKISATNLDLRLDSKENSDELSELANTFNAMLERLENSFDAQKNFVSNISHEIRTPLSAIISELELSANSELKTFDCQKVIRNALKDANKLVKLSNILLDFAKANYDPMEISFKLIRVDESLLDARHQILQSNPDYSVEINFVDFSNLDQELLIEGNEYLLKVAFVNLIENGCKFSVNHQSLVTISTVKNLVKLSFEDKGIGISEKDIEHIYTPFYRGDNKKFADGNGIGLPLTKKIIQLHQGEITLLSEAGKGTTFTLLFPLAAV